jgi:hypothetical protein
VDNRKKMAQARVDRTFNEYRKACAANPRRIGKAANDREQYALGHLMSAVLKVAARPPASRKRTKGDTE